MRVERDESEDPEWGPRFIRIVLCCLGGTKYDSKKSGPLFVLAP